MERCNYHTHTTYCDGKNTAEEMVLAAIGLGFTRLGFSGHSYTDYDPSYPMSRADTPRYCAEIRRLREKYAGQIEIYLGMELDSYGDPPAEPLDYTIGSVHGVPRGGAFAHVDESRERQTRDVRELFGGDYYAFCRAFYAEEAQVKRRTGCDIIGHFDLVTRLNDSMRVLAEN